jgi:uncharacterized protein
VRSVGVASLDIGTSASGRIEALDVMRGTAVLGILLINIAGMGGPFTVRPWQIARSDADWSAWWIGELLVAGTQRGLLELLFGATMVILTARAARPDGPVEVADIYYRRTLLLATAGLIHGLLLLWPGDILLVYGLAGLTIFPFRNLRPRTLLLIGAAGLLFVQASDAVPRYVEARTLSDQLEAAAARARAGIPPTAEDRESTASWSKLRAALDAGAGDPEREARLGGYLDNLGWAHDKLIDQIPDLLLEVGEALFTMLIGAALFKSGVLQGTRTRRFYVLLAVGGYAVGVPLNAMEAAQHTTPSLDPKLVWATYDVSRLATTLGHIGVIALLLSTGAGRRFLAPIGATGRIAFTTYLCQTLVCQFVLFSGFGLGLWGRFGYAELWAIALCVIAGQILFAVLWLRRYRMGPFEWAWRSLTYGRRQPLARRGFDAAAHPRS